jgi:catechol 2,3-dioxygenase-like lactoylglutathione lyase family enzyme
LTSPGTEPRPDTAPELRSRASAGPARKSVTAQIASLVALVAMSATAMAQVAAPTAKAPLIEAVDAIGITVGDLDRSIAFYRDVLAFSVAREEESSGAALEQLTGVSGARMRSARLVLGEQAIVLTQFVSPQGRPVPPGGHCNDRSFQHVAIVVADMDRAYQQLRQHHVAFVSTEPQTLPAWNKGAAGIRAFYFADPDEHTLELIWFPAGKGDPRWQRASAGTGTTTAGSPPQPLFLGIDHTAIAVGDTERSLRFYRDTLGMRVAGASENFGTEQEHLNAVFGAHLRITAMRAASGPGIEFLEYLAPRDGRPAPADLHANDLAHWQTVLHARDLQRALASVTAAGATAAPGRATDFADAAYRIKKAALVNDPDGHGLLLAR